MAKTKQRTPAPPADRLVVFDVETGGTNPAVHPITQFAAAALDLTWSELPEVDALEVKIQFDESACDPSALALQRYDRAVWDELAWPAADAVKQISAFLKRHATKPMTSKRTGRPYQVAQLVAHNAAFDCAMLAALFARFDMFCPATIYDPLCTLALARWVSAQVPSPPASHKLADLCAYYGIELDAGSAHDALVDVRATAALARVLRRKVVI